MAAAAVAERRRTESRLGGRADAAVSYSARARVGDRVFRVGAAVRAVNGRSERIDRPERLRRRCRLARARRRRFHLARPGASAAASTAGGGNERERERASE